MKRNDTRSSSFGQKVNVIRLRRSVWSRRAEAVSSGGRRLQGRFRPGGAREGPSARRGAAAPASQQQQQRQTQRGGNAARHHHHADREAARTPPTRRHPGSLYLVLSIRRRKAKSNVDRDASSRRSGHEPVADELGEVQPAKVVALL